MLKERTLGEKSHGMGKLSRPWAERRTRPALSPGAVPRLDGAWVGVVAGLLHPGCCCCKKNSLCCHLPLLGFPAAGPAPWGGSAVGCGLWGAALGAPAPLGLGLRSRWSLVMAALGLLGAPLHPHLPPLIQFPPWWLLVQHGLGCYSLPHGGCCLPDLCAWGK